MLLLCQIDLIEKKLLQPEAANQQIQRIVTKNKQDFIKFNGVWYKVAKDKFDKVARPDY